MAPETMPQESMIRAIQIRAPTLRDGRKAQTAVIPRSRLYGSSRPQAEVPSVRKICCIRRKADLADRLAASYRDCALAAAVLGQTP
jgi:hypothetical protein